MAVEVPPGFTDDWYVALLVRRLTESWGLERREEGLSLVRRSVRVSFRIAGNGTIDNVILMGSSGNAAFDRAAIASVRQVSPMRPLPSSWGRENLSVNVRFSEH